jgi:hypothetical protein
MLLVATKGLNEEAKGRRLQGCEVKRPGYWGLVDSLNV